MATLLQVVLPVFLVIGFGYVAVARGLFSDAGVDGLMRFTQKFAIPCLLFRAISTINLEDSFEFELLLSFYAGAVGGFVVGLLGARLLFDRPWEDSVVIGFCGLFSNSVLLGIPIAERAYGPDSLWANYAIIAFHSPFCYMLGISAMEIARSGGIRGISTILNILKAMFSNALIIGIALGFAVNLSGVTLPVPVTDAVDLMVQAALPAALFGLGGVLVRYRPEGDLRTILFIITVSLVMHPAITFGLASYFDLPRDPLNAAVLTAAMAPGINAYVFADMYGRARRVAASAVLFGTASALVTVWMWLWILG